MGCTTSSRNATAGNGAVKNNDVLDHLNGAANGNFDPMKSSINDLLTDGSNLDFQNAKKDLEEVSK